CNRERPIPRVVSYFAQDPATLNEATSWKRHTRQTLSDPRKYPECLLDTGVQIFQGGHALHGHFTFMTKRDAKKRDKLLHDSWIAVEQEN
ncbi:MAG: hypothetical protein Q9206_001198, partial [Seirophora lacunosa]